MAFKSVPLSVFHLKSPLKRPVKLNVMCFKMPPFRTHPRTIAYFSTGVNLYTCRRSVYIWSMLHLPPSILCIPMISSTYRHLTIILLSESSPFLLLNGNWFFWKPFLKHRQRFWKSHQIKVHPVPSIVNTISPQKKPLLSIILNNEICFYIHIDKTLDNHCFLAAFVFFYQNNLFTPCRTILTL